MSVFDLKIVDPDESFKQVEDDVKDIPIEAQILELLGSFRQKNHKGYIPTVVIANTAGNRERLQPFVFNNGEPFTYKDIEKLYVVFKKDYSCDTKDLSKRGIGMRAILNKYTPDKSDLNDLNDK